MRRSALIFRQPVLFINLTKFLLLVFVFSGMSDWCIDKCFEA